jgi:hypothetical protein
MIARYKQANDRVKATPRRPAKVHDKKPQGGRSRAEAPPEHGRTLAARQATDRGKAMPRHRRSLTAIASIRRGECGEADAPPSHGQKSSCPVVSNPDAHAVKKPSD